jgi:hypothetical protein
MIYKSYAKYYPQTLLANAPDTFAVDSEVIDGLTYAVHKGHFFVLRGHDVRYSPLNEVWDLIAMCRVDDMKTEMKEIAEDIIIFDRDNREYAKFKDKGRIKNE